MMKNRIALEMKSIPPLMALAMFLVIGSCSPRQSKAVGNHKSFMPGLYTPTKPNLKQSIIWKMKYESYFGNPLIIAFDFKGDSTYKVIGCARTVLHTGKWYIKDDSIMLYNRVNPDNKKIPNWSLLFHDGYIFYPQKLQNIKDSEIADSSNMKKGHKKITTFTSVLKIGGEFFDGKLK
jgi:hypothetical protein